MPSTGFPPWKLTFLGVGGARSDLRVGYPAFLLQIGPRRILVNVGDGSLRQLFRFDRARAVDEIWLTSWETECVSGIPAYAQYFDAILERHELLIRGPEDPTNRRGLLSDMMGPIEGVRWFVAESSFEFANVTVSCAVVGSSDVGPRIGYRVDESPVRGHLDLEAARVAGISPGPEMGSLQRGESVRGVSPSDVFGPDRKGRSVTIFVGGREVDSIRSLARGAQLLIASAPYIDERFRTAVHSDFLTGVEASRLAASEGVETLCLCQISRHVRVSYARREAAQFHPRVSLPTDGDSINIALPDEGPVTIDQHQYKGTGASRRAPGAQPTGPTKR